MSGVKLKLAAIFLHKCLHDVKCHVKNLSCPRKRFVIIGKASNSIYVHKLKSLERNIEEEDHPLRALSPHLKSDCRRDVAHVVSYDSYQQVHFCRHKNLLTMGTPLAHERSLGRKLQNCAKVGQCNLSITVNVILSPLPLIVRFPVLQY